MSEDKTNICPVCNKGFGSLKLGGFTPHSKVVCMICSRAIGKSCAKYGKTKPPLPEKDGPICPDCFEEKRAHIVAGSMLSLSEIIIQLDSLVRGWMAEVDKRIENRLADIDKRIENRFTDIDKRVENHSADIGKYIQSQIKHLFGYLWMMLCFSIFVGLFGFFLFLLTQRATAGPRMLLPTFRLGLVVLVGIPWGTWFISALVRAIRNRSLEAYRKETRMESPLSLRDYLFGFVYFKDPVQNIWFPIAFVGTILAVLLYIIFTLWVR